MAEHYMPFNSVITDGIPDRAIDADKFGTYISSFFSEGVFNLKSGLSFKLYTRDDMSVVIGTGKAHLKEKFYYSDSPLKFILAPADGVLNRIDTIVLRLDKDNRTVGLKQVKGTFAVNPTAPDVIRQENGIYDLQLYRIRVNAGATKIEQKDITDMRLNNPVCGVVAMAVDHIDTTTLYNQIQADLMHFKNDTQTDYDTWTEEKKQIWLTWLSSFKEAYIDAFEEWYRKFKAENETDFNEWFAGAKDILDGNQAGNLYNFVDVHKKETINANGGVHGLRLKDNKLQVNTGTGWASLMEVPTGMDADYFSGLCMTAAQFNALQWTVNAFNNNIMTEEI